MKRRSIRTSRTPTGTCFFRDPEVWKALERQILPSLIEDRDRDRDLRVWVAGCATGEDAYSIAILLAEAFGEDFGPSTVRVFATDGDAAAVDFARLARYAATRTERLEKRRRARWFVDGFDGFTVRRPIRRVMVFGVGEVGSHPPIANIDLIVCRYVLVDLAPELQRDLLRGFGAALRPGGILFLGKGERIPRDAGPFESLDYPRRIFRRAPTAADPRDLVLRPGETARREEDRRRGIDDDLQSSIEELEATNEELLATSQELEAANAGRLSSDAAVDLAHHELASRLSELELATLRERAVTASLGAAIVTVDRAGTVTTWNPAAERLLDVAQRAAIGAPFGEITLRTLPARLAGSVRSAISTGRALRRTDVPLRGATGAPGHATVTVVPLVRSAAPQGAVLLVEERVSERPGRPRAKRGSGKSKRRRAR